MIDHRYTAEEAVELSTRYQVAVFPVSALKRPVRAGSWKTYSTDHPDEIRGLWTDRRYHLAVDLGKSKLVVFDQDQELSTPNQIYTALQDSDTLTLRSINRGMPHWYFRQPAGRPIGNSVWAGGDVKGHGGYVVVSKHEPLNDAPIADVPAVLVVERAVADRRAIRSQPLNRIGGDDPRRGPVDVGAVARYLGVSPLEVQVVLDATRRVG